jgi:hypothetical protein
VALVRDGRRVTVYLDGNRDPEVRGEAAEGSPGGVDEVFIGGRNDNFANFEGRIDEVAIYNRTLPADEITRHYAAGTSQERQGD